MLDKRTHFNYIFNRYKIFIYIYKLVRRDELGTSITIYETEEIFWGKITASYFRQERPASADISTWEAYHGIPHAAQTLLPDALGNNDTLLLTANLFLFYYYFLQLLYL